MGDRLSEIKNRWEKASPGPWHTERDEYGNDAYSDAVIAPQVGGPESELTMVAQCDSEWRSNETEANATFIAHSWEDIAWLVAENEKLHSELASLRDHPGWVDPLPPEER